MSATAALQAARAAGVRVALDGEFLLLEADAEPPRSVLGALRRHKAALLDLRGPNPAGDSSAAIEERAGISSDRVPPCYLDDWAKLNHQKPARASEAEWRLALDDGGRFLIDGDGKRLNWTGGRASCLRLRQGSFGVSAASLL